jgi:hypothetical protein
MTELEYLDEMIARLDELIAASSPLSKEAMKEHTLFTVEVSKGDMHVTLSKAERNHPARHYRLVLDHYANGTREVAELGFYQVLQLHHGFAEAVAEVDPSVTSAPRTISIETLAIVLRGFQGMGLLPRDSGAERWDELPPSVVEQWERYAELVWGAVERLTRESKTAEPEVTEAKP